MSAAVVLYPNWTANVSPTTGAHVAVVGERDLRTARVAGVTDDVRSGEPGIAGTRETLIDDVVLFRIPMKAIPSAPTIIASITIATNTSTSVKPEAS